MDVLVLANLEQQLELFSEQRVVVIEVEAEQRKRLDRRASADHHFGPAARQQVERCEFLEQTNRVNGAQHRHRTREPDGLRARRGRTENNGRGGIEELAAVVLPNAKRIQPQLIGVLDLLDQIAQTVGCADRAAVLGERCREAVDTDFHVFLQGARPSRQRALATRFNRRATARGSTSGRHARGCRVRVPPSVAPSRAIPSRLSRREWSSWPRRSRASRQRPKVLNSPGRCPFGYRTAYVV